MSGDRLPGAAVPVDLIGPRRSFRLILEVRLPPQLLSSVFEETKELMRKIMQKILVYFRADPLRFSGSSYSLAQWSAKGGCRAACGSLAP
ncbi:hypothetical protein TNCV_222381 [Trichonephila clavipes]|nr:hypothetical protein TNCV_222381 [Trichonephila clavipes]